MGQTAISPQFVTSTLIDIADDPITAKTEIDFVLGQVSSSISTRRFTAKVIVYDETDDDGTYLLCQVAEGTSAMVGGFTTAGTDTLKDDMREALGEYLTVK